MPINAYEARELAKSAVKEDLIPIYQSIQKAASRGKSSVTIDVKDFETLNTFMDILEEKDFKVKGNRKYLIISW